MYKCIFDQRYFQLMMGLLGHNLISQGRSVLQSGFQISPLPKLPLFKAIRELLDNKSTWYFFSLDQSSQKHWTMFDHFLLEILSPIFTAFLTHFNFSFYFFGCFFLNILASSSDLNSRPSSHCTLLLKLVHPLPWI